MTRPLAEQPLTRLLSSLSLAAGLRPAPLPHPPPAPLPLLTSPCRGDAALVAAAIRHAKAQTQLDLSPALAADASGATGFTRFVEVHYTVRWRMGGRATRRVGWGSDFGTCRPGQRCWLHVPPPARTCIPASSTLLAPTHP